MIETNLVKYDLARFIILSTIIIGYFFDRSLALNNNNNPSSSRRKVFEQVNTILGGGILLSSSSSPANAVKGAAEYDLEYYIRDLVKGNPIEGTVGGSKGPPVPPPRTLAGPLLPLLLNKDCTAECIPGKVLLDLANDKEKFVDKFQFYRNGAKNSYYGRAAWKEESIEDQYYFDYTAYAFWRTAADLLPDYKVRDKFARDIGRQIYASNVISQKATENKNSPLTSTIPILTEILNLFTKTQYMKAYKLGDDKNKGFPIFDEFDDNDLKSGTSVNCLISIYEPATLRSSLQITNEQSRFIPDYVGSTLTAMWESVDITVSSETYFVDPEYRPNPKDYFPNEQLIQFTLTEK